MSIKMISTRDELKTEKSYTDVLLAGLAPDGGLYVPTEYPQISLEELKDLQGKSYQEIAFDLKQKLVGGAIPDEDLKKLINQAYTSESFLESDGKNITPLEKISDNFYIQNLSLGPTAAFKDMALQQLGQEMNYELEKRQENLTILGATSGDTGSSAEAAFKGLKRVKLFMLSPEVGMSNFQKAQMGSLTGDNIFNISVKGRFDDCQDLVKLLKSEEEFSKLGAVNSINWGRISSQVPYYFAGYLQAVKNIGDEVDFTVPSGNFGNVLSGYIAKKMGLPIRKLIIATNENNVLDKLVKTGIYELTPAEITSSPSMDISKASNYERLLYDILGRDGKKVAQYMKEFTEKKKVDLEDYEIDKNIFQKLGFLSGKSTHQDRMGAIKKVYDLSKIVIDTHTADAVNIGFKKQDIKVPMICMSTALPVKFEDSIQEALDFIPERPKHFIGLENNLSENAFQFIENNPEQLREIIRENIN